MPSPEKALYDLLLSLFTPAELRRVLTHEYGQDLVAALPHSGTASDLAFAATQRLQRSGLVAPELFLALVAAAPGRHRDIAAVAQAFGFSPPPPSTPAAFACPAPAAGPPASRPANLGGGGAASPAAAAADTLPLRWLQLSDLHVGCRGEAVWWTMLDRFWRSLDRWLGVVGAPDLVLLTGDLTNRGERAEFDKLSKFMERLLARLPKAGDGLPPLVVAVPGNHDLQRPSGSGARQYRLLRDYEKGNDDPDVAGLLDELWGKPGSKPDASFLRPLFVNYQEWFDGFIRPQGARPGVKLHTSFFPGDLMVSLDLPGRFPLAIVGLNSAWMQYQGGDFEGKLALPVEQFHAALPHAVGTSPLGALEGQHRALLLMHHPRGWLSKPQRQLFDSGIYPSERFAACLHGHMHEADSVNTSRAGGMARCYYQAPSLFGMEEYGTANESRAIGYTWAKLRDDGELRAWPLKWQRKGDGVEDFDRDPYFHWEDGPENVLLRAGDGRRYNRPRSGGGSRGGGSNGADDSRTRIEVAEPAAILAYRTWLLGQKHGVKLIGVGGGDMSLDLDAVYVPLRATARILDAEDGAATGPRAGDPPVAARGSVAKRARRSQSSEGPPPASERCEQDFAVDTLFRHIKAPHALILGEPGAGKTTALHKLQRVCSLEGPEALGLAPGTLPVPLWLRRFSEAGRRRSLAGWLGDELAERSKGELPAELGTALWTHGRLLLLTDGLDEVADEGLRAKLCGYIEAQLKGPETEHMRAVVSCRYAGYRRAVALDSRFDVLELRPLGAEQVRELVRLWFAEAAIKVAGVSSAEAQERGEGLIAAIEGPAYAIQRLKVMVSTPLLLTLLCVIVHQGRQMPKSRVAYYERCLEVLLLRWGQEHKRREAPLDLDRALAVLRPLAYALHDSGERDSNMRGDLVVMVNRRLRALGLAANGIAVVDWLQRDAGVLQEFAPEHLGFAHLGLQEYLAATHIEEDEALLEVLVDKAGDEWWMEVALLVAAQRVAFQPLMRRALRTQIHRGDLIEALLDEAPEAEPTPLLERLGEPGEPQEVAAVLRLLRRFRHDPKVREAAVARKSDADAEVRALAAQLLETRDGIDAGGEWDVVLVFTGPQQRMAEALARKLVEAHVRVYRDAQGRLVDALSMQGDLAAAAAAAPCVVALCGQDGPAWAERAAESCLRMFADAGKALGWVLLSGGAGPVWPLEFGASKGFDVRANGGFEPLRRWLATARHGARGIVQGETFTEESTGIRFLWVPGGCFVMGMEGVAEPVHRVCLSPYWLAEMPVTNMQYAKFLDGKSGHKEPAYWRDRRLSGEAQPVVGVSWGDATAFCDWLSRRPTLVAAGVTMMLPSEAQWELAARGTDGRRYPWGEASPDSTRAVFGREEGTARVGSRPAGQGPFGHLDLAGNVWQWCRDGWDDEAYRGRLGREVVDPVEPHRDKYRVLRGGSWRQKRVMAAAVRVKDGTWARDDDDGFRVAAVPVRR